MNENLENFSYDSKDGVKICTETAAEIQRKIKAFKFDRYSYPKDIVLFQTHFEFFNQAFKSLLSILINITFIFILNSTYFRVKVLI